MDLRFTSVSGLEIASIVGGLLSLYNIFSAAQRATRKENDDVEEQLKTNYKSRIEFLEGELKRLKSESERRDSEWQKQLSVLQQEVIKLKAEKATALDILQGRDEETVRTAREAIKAIPLAQEAVAIMKSNNTLLQELTKTQNTFIIQHGKDMETILATCQSKEN